MSDDGPSDDSIDATTFQGLTPNGSPFLLEMRVMGFGLCNASSTYTRLTTHVMDPCIHQFGVVYFDDIYIYSKSPKEHFDRIRQVFSFLRKIHYLIKWLIFFWLNGKLNTSVIFLGIATFEHPLLKS